MGAGELGARVSLSLGETCSAERKELEAAIRDRDQVSVPFVERRDGIDQDHRRRLREDPDEPCPLADDERRLPRDDREKRAFEAGPSQAEDDERGDGLKAEGPHTSRVLVLPCRRD